jgi:hypothetical protein
MKIVHASLFTSQNMKYRIQEIYTYQNFLVHGRVASRLRGVAGPGASLSGSRSTSLKIIRHFRIKFLGSLLSWAGVATTTFACCAASTTATCACILGRNSGLGLGLWLTAGSIRCYILGL